MNLQEFTCQVVPLKNKLFRFAKRFLENNPEAEDVVQEVFIKLWEKRDRLDEYRSVEALAMVSVKNMCLDKLKSKKYPVENMEDHKKFIENLPEEPVFDYSDEINRIRMAMRYLPRPQQMILHLRDIEGYDYESIAELMDMNENAVRVSISRARKRIRELITTTKIYEYQRN